MQKNLSKKLGLSETIKVPKYAQKSLIFKSVIRSQFSYCPIMWMFCSRRTNNIINNLHEMVLRIVLNDQTSNLETLFGEKVYLQIIFASKLYLQPSWKYSNTHDGNV